MTLSLPTTLQRGRLRPPCCRTEGGQEGGAKGGIFVDEMLAITKEERKQSIKWPRRKGEEDGQDGEAGCT